MFLCLFVYDFFASLLSHACFLFWVQLVFCYGFFNLWLRSLVLHLYLSLLSVSVLFYIPSFLYLSFSLFAPLFLFFSPLSLIFLLSPRSYISLLVCLYVRVCLCVRVFSSFSAPSFHLSSFLHFNVFESLLFLPLSLHKLFLLNPSLQRRLWQQQLLRFRAFLSQNICPTDILSTQYKMILSNQLHIVNLNHSLTIINFVLAKCQANDRAGNSDWRGRLCTIDLLIKVACFVRKVNNIFTINWADAHWLVQGGQPYLIFPFHKGFPGSHVFCL